MLKDMLATNSFVQHRLAQANVEEAAATIPAPFDEPPFCPFWSCIPNLDAIVALRASLVAFNSPHVPSASSDDEFADLYSLCAARCCDAAVAFVDSKSPFTPTQIARNIQSTPLLSPDSSGADGFEGALAAHTACDLLNMVSWLTCQSACDSVANAADADRLCPIDLVNNMAAAAAQLSDSHMYDLIRFNSIVHRICTNVICVQYLHSRPAPARFSKHTRRVWWCCLLHVRGQ